MKMPRGDRFRAISPAFIAGVPTSSPSLSVLSDGIPLPLLPVHVPATGEFPVDPGFIAAQRGGRDQISEVARKRLPVHEPRGDTRGLSPGDASESLSVSLIPLCP